MKLLDGRELAGYIKQRQAREVRSIRQSLHQYPKLAIIVTVDNPVINLYVRLKRRYGADIGIEVVEHRISQGEVIALLDKLNADESIHGIIIQLPLADNIETEKLVNLVNPEKDVDALGVRSKFVPATPTAILWLLAGYNIDLPAKKILLVGKGKLVGTPLQKMLEESGLNVTVADRSTENLNEKTLAADLIITATGSPGLLMPDMVKSEAIIVDAGVASEDGKTVGDVAEEMYQKPHITITPQKGGVGPLTVCALFENVLIAARRKGELLGR